MDEILKKDLIRFVNALSMHRSLTQIFNHKYLPSECGCLGPTNGYSICNCALYSELQKHKLEILNEFDPEAALMLMRKNLIIALGG